LILLNSASNSSSVSLVIRQHLKTFSQEAKEALAKLWGEYTRLGTVDRQTRGPEIRKTLALIEEILARTPPDAELW
jgi:hypothetical protein